VAVALGAAPFAPILFDLDGTLAETHPGIYAAVDETLGELGLSALEHERVRALTGKGVAVLVRTVLEEVGAPLELLPKALERYQAHYDLRCAQGASLFPGMAALLLRLPPPLGLITNKARRFTAPILAHLGLAERFAVVVAGDDPGARMKPDPWPVEEALGRLGMTRERAILVGDTESDARTAKAAGIACCLVGWGHVGGEAHSPYRAERVADLERLLTQQVPSLSLP
jgi:2-phosphoglycolate phosphatase